MFTWITRSRMVLAGKITLVGIGSIWVLAVSFAALLALVNSAALGAYAVWGQETSIQRQLLAVEAALLLFVGIKAAKVARNSMSSLMYMYDKFWPIVYQEQ